jgi:hypothetical protein
MPSLLFKKFFKNKKPLSELPQGFREGFAQNSFTFCLKVKAMGA